MGEDAMNTVRDRYTWETAAIKTEEVYNIAMQRANRSSHRQSLEATVKDDPSDVTAETLSLQSTTNVVPASQYGSESEA